MEKREQRGNQGTVGGDHLIECNRCVVLQNKSGLIVTQAAAYELTLPVYGVKYELYGRLVHMVINVCPVNGFE